MLSAIFVTSPANAAEPSKMIVPYTPLTGASTPFWIAIEQKLFQKYGIEIAPLFISGGSSAIVPAMTAGQFDIGAVGGGAVVLNRFSGGDLITIGAQTGVYTTDCFAKPEIKSIRDLKGKTIAVTRFGTSTHFAGLSMLRLGGLKPTDVVFIQIGGSSEAIAGLSSGRVDAAMLGYPVSDVALKKGFRQLTDLAKGEDGAFPTTAIAARESWLKDSKNREITLNFLRGFTDGLTLART
ncbi:MAG TPA: ABC transporter substrate-binding protein, partial [Candidatus Bathyarchaeia archaeon]|nr:ABC transporter substrate-binding protein [Candidatus Bathyarchaeia archaeon]